MIKPQLMIRESKIMTICFQPPIWLKLNFVEP